MGMILKLAWFASGCAAVGLILWIGAGAVFGAVAAAGWGVAVVVVLRGVAVWAAGVGWFFLFPEGSRPTAWTCVLIRFLREGANALLPITQVGGEVIGARVLTLRGAPASLSAASVIVDVLVQAVTQFLFAAVGLAALAAMRQDRAADHAVRLFSLMGLGMPSFWFGIILIVLLSVDVHVFPVGGYGTSFWTHLHSLVLPGLCAAIGIVPVLIRSLRVGMLEVLSADYVATARAKGLRPSRVTFVHVARNALIPTVTLLGINIAYLIGGTVVIERVFALNGLGNLMLNAIDFRDFPVVQGVTLIYALGVIIVILLTDLVTARLDPRIRLK